MLPTISQKREEDGELSFTMKDLNVSVMNAVRRTILSDIPSVVFHTFPYSENNCEIQKNTTRFNNEIIKHRLSLVPIHITDLSIPLENYLLEVNKQNNSEVIQYITTEDFQIKDVVTGNTLSKGERDKIFPKNGMTNHYLEFLRLRPSLATNLEGEALQLTCKFSISTAKDNSAYNQTSTCFYKNTLDAVRANDIWKAKEKELKAQGLDADQLAFEKKNWYLLEGQRVFAPDSFDFRLKTIGIFENAELLQKAFDILLKTLGEIQHAVDVDDTAVISIEPSQSTMANSYDIILKNNDYTIGKVIEYYMYSLHFEGDKLLSFCGFNKEHPHNDYSVLRIAFRNTTEVPVIKQFLRDALSAGAAVYSHMKTLF